MYLTFCQSRRLLQQKVYEAVLEFQTLKPAPKGSTGAGTKAKEKRQNFQTEERQEEMKFRH